MDKVPPFINIIEKVVLNLSVMTNNSNINKFYDGTELLERKDINGNKPEVIMCIGNRTAGKTYFFKSWILKQCLKEHSCFMLLCRKKPEVDSVCESFFTDIGNEFPDNSVLSYKKFNAGLYNEIYFNGEKVGYCTYLNGVEQIKRISTLFYDVIYMLFDEVISETGLYLEKEITKLISLHVSIARGGKNGKSVRFVLLILIGNSATAINPYFTALDVNINNLTRDTRFYDGDGYVIEFTLNKNASQELKSSSFARAFSKSAYLQGSIDNSMYLDTQDYIFKSLPKGSTYILSIIGREKFIGVYQGKDGCLYFSSSCNVSYKFKCTLDRGYEKPNLPHITTTIFYTKLRNLVLKGKTFYSNIEIRKIVLDAIGRSLV